jgi:hypothetical protein
MTAIIPQSIPHRRRGRDDDRTPFVGPPPRLAELGEVAPDRIALGRLVAMRRGGRWRKARWRHTWRPASAAGAPRAIRRGPRSRRQRATARPRPRSTPGRPAPCPAGSAGRSPPRQIARPRSRSPSAAGRRNTAAADARSSPALQRLGHVQILAQLLNRKRMRWGAVRRSHTASVQGRQAFANSFWATAALGALRRVAEQLDNVTHGSGDRACRSAALGGAKGSGRRCAMCSKAPPTSERLRRLSTRFPGVGRNGPTPGVCTGFAASCAPGERSARSHPRSGSRS